MSQKCTFNYWNQVYFLKISWLKQVCFHSLEIAIKFTKQNEQNENPFHYLAGKSLDFLNFSIFMVEVYISLFKELPNYKKEISMFVHRKLNIFWAFHSSSVFDNCSKASFLFQTVFPYTFNSYWRLPQKWLTFSTFLRKTAESMQIWQIDLSIQSSMWW